MDINKKYDEIYSQKKLKINIGSYPVPKDVKGKVAIDIGSNNGSFLDLHKNTFSKIHAYEANFFLVKKLKQKFNHKHISIFHKAVGKNDGEIFNLKGHESVEDASYAIEKENVRPDWKGLDTVCQVESISLESILDKVNNKVDYMQIDCQTSEYELLMGKNLKNIKYIAIELHDQLGAKQYNELYKFICKTHKANKPVNFVEYSNQKIFFTLK